MSEFSEVAGTVVRRDRFGYRLLTGYYVLATVVVVVGCATRPADAGTFTGSGVLTGVILLAYVSVANRRALRPLDERWPQLARVPARRVRRPGRTG